MLKNVRPCTYWFMGKKDVGLFHCFGKATRKLGQKNYDGETVAIVENRHGAVLEISTNNIHLLDSEQQISEFFVFKEVGDNND